MEALETKARREALGLSRDALAVTLGIREENVTRWEFGKNPPRDWSWIFRALTSLEDYRESLVAQMVDEAVTMHAESGSALLMSYVHRGSFYHWNPEALEADGLEEVAQIPVELHRSACAEAARRLRVQHGIHALIEAVPVPEPAAG